jgi:hypothetical protein
MPGAIGCRTSRSRSALLKRFDQSGASFKSSGSGDFADSPDSLAVFAVPKRIGLKSNRRLSRVLIKSSLITSPDVSTQLRPGLKKPVGLDLRWNRRLARSPDPTGAPSQAEVRPLFKAPREDGSWFRTELDCGYAVQQTNLNKK